MITNIVDSNYECQTAIATLLDLSKIYQSRSEGDGNWATVDHTSPTSQKQPRPTSCHWKIMMEVEK